MVFLSVNYCPSDHIADLTVMVNHSQFAISCRENDNSPEVVQIRQAFQILRVNRPRSILQKRTTFSKLC